MGATSERDLFHNEHAWVQAGTAQLSQPVLVRSDSTRVRPDGEPPGESRFILDWVDLRYAPSEPWAADPAYPDGVGIDVALTAEKACRLELPYPAEGCGQWVITCRACGFAIALATAGRADDPRSVRVPCKSR